MSKIPEKDKSKQSTTNTNELKDTFIDTKNLQSLVYQKLEDIEQLKELNTKYLTQILNLEQQINDLNKGAIKTYETERFIKSLQMEIEKLKKEKEDNLRSFEVQIKKVEDDFKIQISKLERDIKMLTDSN